MILFGTKKIKITKNAFSKHDNNEPPAETHSYGSQHLLSHNWKHLKFERQKGCMSTVSLLPALFWLGHKKVSQSMHNIIKIIYTSVTYIHFICKTI